MSFTNETQNPLLGTANIEPLDEFFAAMENLTAVGDAGSVNIPWLLAISVSIGNATTSAISKNCVVFCEPEWGFDTGSGKASMFGGSGDGASGVYVGW
jgi:DNA-binding CsgD family transcriptional regulator